MGKNSTVVIELLIELSKNNDRIFYGSALRVCYGFALVDAEQCKELKTLQFLWRVQVFPSMY